MLNNPMLTALNQNKTMQGMAKVKQLMKTVRSAGNPQMFLNQMMGQNPQIKQAMDFVNANGGDPQAAFYKLAEQRGVDPDEFMKQLMN